MSRKEPSIEKFTLEEINQVRVREGLPIIELKMKSCMNCDSQFESEGPHNRLCKKCRGKNPNGMGKIIMMGK